MRLKISSRKSDLARLQAYTVGETLAAAIPEMEVEYFFSESLGDKNLTDPLWKMPEKGVFTEDFYLALKNGDTDMVVHSWKDLPTAHKDDTVIAATLPRADQRDLLLFKKSHRSMVEANKAIRIFSSSPRREHNLTSFLQDHLPFSLNSVKFENVRGNVPTRLRKLIESEEVSALIVAKAALDRLLSAPQAEFADVKKQLRGYLEELDFMVLPLSINPNAAAQGALAIEIMKDRDDLKKILEKINHPSTFTCAQLERDTLSSFGGGCHQKIGVTVLDRDYGKVISLKGLTDSGVVLDRFQVEKSEAVQKFPSAQMLLVQTETERIPVLLPKVPAGSNAYFVARKEAWNSELPSPRYVWTAGLKTWQSLAEKGVWVHGSTEGLGEQERPQIETLATEPLQWVKLSHQEGYEADATAMPLLATYRLETSFANTEEFASKEAFFWSSGSQFLAALKLYPELAGKHHACGPGNTYKIIRQQLELNGDFDKTRVQIFIDSDDWRKQCSL